MRGKPGPRSITVDPAPNSNHGHCKIGPIVAGCRSTLFAPENAFIESFNGRLREEGLNVHQFQSLNAAQTMIEAWQQDYNHRSPHSSLGHLTPNEFMRQRQINQTAEAALCKNRRGVKVSPGSG